MFKSLDLSLIVEFILMFYRDKPIDWLLDHILWVKVCNPEKDAVSRGYWESVLGRRVLGRQLTLYSWLCLYSKERILLAEEIPWLS